MLKGITYVERKASKGKTKPCPSKLRIVRPFQSRADLSRYIFIMGVKSLFRHYTQQWFANLKVPPQPSSRTIHAAFVGTAKQVHQPTTVV